mgnify:FL=1
MENGGIIKVIVFICIAFASFLIISELFSSLTPKPTLEILECSLNPTDVKINQSSNLIFKVKNNDKDESHVLKVTFDSHYLVSFFLGNEPLSQSDGEWCFSEVINPSEETTQTITVKASLEHGVGQLTYDITVKFYVDDQHLLTKKLKLSVST